MVLKAIDDIMTIELAADTAPRKANKVNHVCPPTPGKNNTYASEGTVSPNSNCPANPSGAAKKAKTST
jgi:hypothetical protein